jgi:hypothetical protein
MTPKTNKTKTNRASKGQRTHVRRMKQAALRDGTIYSPPRVSPVPAKAAGE